MNINYLEEKSKALNYNLNISLEDIYNGIVKELEINLIKYTPKKEEYKRILKIYSSEKELIFKNQGNQDKYLTVPGDIIINIYPKKHPEMKIIHAIFIKKYYL